MKSYLLPAAALLALAFSAQSHAAIIYSGVLDIPIPTTLDGVYLDLDSGTFSASEMAGWDINAFFGGEAVANSPAFQPVRSTAANDSPLQNLASGVTVDLSSIVSSGFAGSETHIGNSPGQFTNGVEGYIGFHFVPIGEMDPVFGWMRLVLNNDGNPGLIRDWAFDDSGAAIQVAAIPEPSALLAFSMAGSLFLILGRKRPQTASPD